MRRTQSVQELRKQRGWSQTELAFKASVDSALIPYLERGQIATPVDKLRRIAEVFDVPIEGITLPAHERLINIRNHYFLLSAHRGQSGEGRWRAKVMAWEYQTAVEWPVRAVDEAFPDDISPSMILNRDEWSAEGSSADEALTALADRVRTAMERALHRGPLPGEPADWQAPETPEHWKQHLEALNRRGRSLRQ